MVEELRAQAREESARIIARGEEQLHSQRGQVVRELRGEVGFLAVELSEKIVGQRLADDAQVRATVDSFLADLEQRDTAGLGGMIRRREPPRDGRTAPRIWITATAQTSAAMLTDARATSCTPWPVCSAREPALRRTLADPSTSPEARAELIAHVLDGNVAGPHRRAWCERRSAADGRRRGT